MTSTTQWRHASDSLAAAIKERFGDMLSECVAHLGEVTIEVPREHQLRVARDLSDDSAFAFKQLVDLCGVDYLEYGKTEWATATASGKGFSRGVEASESLSAVPQDRRFAVVYHLLSHQHNERLRMRVFAEDEPPILDSVIDIWPVANWYEREAFDLYGLMFEGHPDLRRILTDYGFIGHPFRKDFPLIGQVEMRYDAEKKRVVYQPVSIEPRVLVPRVIREDSRYAETAPAPQAGDDGE